ncbi:MAG TPA: TIGR01777 family oxidoreductase [Polyangia bacterium]|nr:TIGR01777 family oxidoreductase [Polyangia bacterium]
MAEKILIAGATGLLGTALAAACTRDGDSVVALVRDVARAAPKLPGVTLHAWDGLKGPPPTAAFEGVTAVVNLVGESIAGKRWSDERKRVLRASRIDTTRALVEGIKGASAKPRVLVQASGSGIYGDRGDEVLTESSSPGAGFLAELARDWEAEGQKAAEAGARVVFLRQGVVLSRGGGFLAKLLPPFRLGLGGHVGTGKQWLPWIHEADAIGLMRHAIATDAATGALNAVAPEPVTNGELTTALGRALGRPTFMTAPAFAMRVALGAQMADELLLASQRAMPVRTLETGYKFKQPLLAPALKDTAI